MQHKGRNRGGFYPQMAPVLDLSGRVLDIVPLLLQFGGQCIDDDLLVVKGFF